MILGHESISTTQIYTHVGDQSLIDAAENNPFNKADISNISKPNAPHVAFANNMVNLRKKEDFQRRF